MTNVYLSGELMNMTSAVVTEVILHLEALPVNLQKHVLAIVRALDVSQPRGVPGARLLKFAGVIPTDDLQTMKRAIEEDCERVNLDEW